MAYPVIPDLPTSPGVATDPTNPTQKQGVDVVGDAYFANGGKNTTAIAGGTVGSNTVIKATPGRLCKVLVTTLGSAALLIYDNATTNSGTLIGVIAASATAGTLVSFDLPAANGITVASGSNQPAVTISWS